MRARSVLISSTSGKEPLNFKAHDDSFLTMLLIACSISVLSINVFLRFKNFKMFKNKIYWDFSFAILGDKLKSVVILSSWFLLFSCASGNGNYFTGNEKLMQSLPLPSGTWEMFEREFDDSGMKEKRWISLNSKDLVQVFVYKNRSLSEGDVYRTKLIWDANGRRACGLSFGSQIISEGRRNGYPYLTWASECRNQGGIYTKVVHSTIMGKDADYLFARVFRSRPTEIEWKKWVQYTETISLCDSRSHPCSERDFKK